MLRDSDLISYRLVVVNAENIFIGQDFLTFSSTLPSDNTLFDSLFYLLKLLLLIDYPQNPSFPASRAFTLMSGWLDTPSLPCRR